MYDYLVVTHLPAFYKVNLYNELSKKLNIYVVFISHNTNEKRSNDFVSLNHVNFEYSVVSQEPFQNRKVLAVVKQLLVMVRQLKFKRVILSGWDLVEFWFLALLIPKKKNCLALESTIFESPTKGIKGFFKKLFISRINTVFASGNLHVELLNKLNFSGNVRVTKGVGIINKPTVQVFNHTYNRKFLFIGRLSAVKNLELLICVFNQLPHHYLTIVGVGEQEVLLKQVANDNVSFIGAVENKNLPQIFKEHDLLVLPSLSETWGLVVEEALYFGLPVLVSSRCGSSQLIKDNVNGHIFAPDNQKKILSLIRDIDEEQYKKLILNVRSEVLSKDLQQVEAYSID